MLRIGYYLCQKICPGLVEMPQLQIDILIKHLKLHVMELHDIYVAEKDFSLAERLLDQVYVIENMLRSLETLV